MRKFQHLAQLSLEELRECLLFIGHKLDQLEQALESEAESELQAKALWSELRHQRRVYQFLSQHAAMRGMVVPL